MYLDFSNEIYYSYEFRCESRPHYRLDRSNHQYLYYFPLENVQEVCLSTSVSTACVQIFNVFETKILKLSTNN